MNSVSFGGGIAFILIAFILYLNPDMVITPVQFLLMGLGSICIGFIIKEDKHRE